MEASLTAPEQQPLLPKPDEPTPSSGDTRTLLLACVMTTFFFLVELAGGYIAGSLAIMSDAAHLLSDLAGFAISLVAVSVSRLPANEYLSFGFARAEVLGAFVSILFIWALTIVLVLFAIHRLFNPSPVNGPLMILLGIVGLIVNLVLGLVLGHGHSHGDAEGHTHAHGHGHGHGHVDVENQVHSPTKVNEFASAGHDHDHSGHDHDHADHHVHNADDEPSFVQTVKAALFGDDSRSVNVRAAYLHVLGDALQNVGVVVAAIIITVRPRWSFVDPLCTLLFAVIVIMTTAGLAKETMGILMEGTPPALQLADIYERLRSLEGVSRVGDLHVWSITPRSPALSVHLYKTAESASHEVLKEAQSMLDSQFGISHATIQVNCETTECCDEEKYFGKGSQKNCVTSDSLQQPNGTA